MGFLDSSPSEERSRVGALIGIPRLGRGAIIHFIQSRFKCSTHLLFDVSKFGISRKS